MPETNVDLSNIQQEAPRHEPQLPTRIDTPPELTSSTASPTEQHQTEQAVDADLIRAKLGVERFKADYAKGNKECQWMLRDTLVGQELQAMYLGLRPMAHIDRGASQVLYKNKDVGFSHYDTMVWVNDLVERVISAHPQAFPDYIPGTTWTDTYMLHNIYPSQDHVQQGLLFGFPANAVEQFARHNDALQQLNVDFHTSEELTPEDEAVLLGLTGRSLR